MVKKNTYTSTLWLKQHFNEIGHITDQFIVQALLVQDNNKINFESFGGMNEQLITLAYHPTTCVDDDSTYSI